METCYKAIRTPLFKSIPIESNDFRIEPELTIKLAKRDARIFEIPISYSGRTYQEGKKINWRDGLRALTAIIKFAVSNNIRRPDHERAHALEFLRAPRLDAWVADVIRRFCGSRVLEIGSGTGAMTLRLVPRTQYVASDSDPLNLQVLEALSGDRPYMRSSYCNVTDLASFPRVPAGYDTVLCLNVLEHVDADDVALVNLRSVLVDGGTAIVQVPHGQWNYSGLDRFLGRRRRYSKKSLQQLADDAGFRVREVFEFNRIGTVAWFLSGKMLRRHSFDHLPMWLFDRFTPFFRAIDFIWPFPGLSLIAVLERREGVGQSSRVSSGSDYAAASLMSAGVASAD
jgi:SAM-dependent methyltransferase